MKMVTRMQGFALIEVLIALFILSFGLLSITDMQLSALSRSREAYYSSLAITQLDSMLERLRANVASDARNDELRRWNQLNLILLPQGEGSYHCQESACEVRLSWRYKQAHSLSLSAHL